MHRALDRHAGQHCRVFNQAALGTDGEARWHGDAEATHFCQVGTLATEQVLHVRRAFNAQVAEQVDVLYGGGLDELHQCQSDYAMTVCVSGPASLLMHVNAVRLNAMTASSNAFVDVTGGAWPMQSGAWASGGPDVAVPPLAIAVCMVQPAGAQDAVPVHGKHAAGPEPVPAGWRDKMKAMGKWI